MRERERLVVGGLVVLLLVLWMGFLVHRSPRFAGSAWGGALGISGAALMLVPLAYLAVKRVPLLKRAVTRRVPMSTLLKWHIYAGVVGPILGLLHTGHKFVSPLGIALTAMMLVTVLSGFAGRYLMGRLSQSIQGKKADLAQMEAAYRQTAGELAAEPERVAPPREAEAFTARLAAAVVPQWAEPTRAARRGLRLAESMAELEYAVRTHEAFRRWFAGWLKLHIVISLTLYALLALHVWAGLYFGLRWFP